MMRRWMTAPMALVLAAGIATAVVPTAYAATATSSTACETGWGSLNKQSPVFDYEHQPITGIRTGTHPCYDRMVIDVPGTSTANPLSYRVQYMDGNTIYQAGSGDPITVGGGAVLEVVVMAPVYDPATWEVVYPAKARQPLPGVDLTGYQTFQDTRFAGSFEGETQFGLGVRARLPYRVFQLDNRLVIDVAHSWGTTA